MMSSLIPLPAPSVAPPVVGMDLQVARSCNAYLLHALVPARLLEMRGLLQGASFTLQTLPKTYSLPGQPSGASFRWCAALYFFAVSQREMWKGPSSPHSGRYGATPSSTDARVRHYSHERIAINISFIVQGNCVGPIGPYAAFCHSLAPASGGLGEAAAERTCAEGHDRGRRRDLKGRHVCYISGA